MSNQIDNNFFIDKVFFLLYDISHAFIFKRILYFILVDTINKLFSLLTFYESRR
jgi:hypothetical protein